MSFVPFFERVTSGEALPQYQFQQYKISKVALAPTQIIRHVEKHELKSKVLSDLKNAIHLSLGEDSLQNILSDLGKFRTAERPVGEPVADENGAAITESSEGEKPYVKLQKDGEKVTSIVVECDCGQVITLDCIY